MGLRILFSLYVLSFAIIFPFMCESISRLSICSAILYVFVFFFFFCQYHTVLEEEMATHSNFCLESPMDRGAWQAIVHGVTKESNITATEHIILFRSPWLLYVLLIYVSILWNQDVWYLQLCSSLKLSWIFMIFCGSIKFLEYLF